VSEGGWGRLLRGLRLAMAYYGWLGRLGCGCGHWGRLQAARAWLWSAMAGYGWLGLAMASQSRLGVAKGG